MWLQLEPLAVEIQVIERGQDWHCLVVVVGLLSFLVAVEEPQLKMEILLELPAETLAEALVVVPLHNPHP